MFLWLKQMLSNFSNFVAGLLLTIPLTAIVFVAGVAAAIMCLVAPVSASPNFKNIRYGLVDA